MVAIICLTVTMGIGAIYIWSLQQEAYESEVRQRATIVATMGQACRDYVADDLRPAVAKHTSAMIFEAMSATFATRTLFAKFNRKLPDYTFREPSSNPLNPINRASPFEKSIIDRFSAEASLTEVTGYYAEGARYYVARPIIVEQKCLKCHEHPDTAPPEIVQKYGRHSGYGWRENDVAGIVMISVPVGDLTAQQSQIYFAIVLTFIGMAIIVSGGIIFAFRRLAINRLRLISEKMSTISKNPQEMSRILDERNDEIGALANTFNRMANGISDSHLLLESRVGQRTAELSAVNIQLQHEVDERTKMEKEREAANRLLVDMSRQAGKAEVATSVLHNVGNVLNSVNVSATMIAERIQQSPSLGLNKVTVMIQEHMRDLGTYITADEKGQLIPKYLISLSECIAEEREVVLKELSTLTKNIGHIKDIVSMQQSYAVSSGVVETVTADSLVDDAVQMNSGALARHDVEVIRDYVELPTLRVDRHKVLQILVNLIHNAKYALDEVSRQQDKKLTLKIGALENRVRIAVIDNGVGILPENLTRIFSRGFTTRKDGHGFGLHSAALAATELGGGLTAQSDGLGMGATFTLELPLQHAESTV